MNGYNEQISQQQQYHNQRPPPPPVNDGKTPHVVIVGAGLAGLLLAILLDQASISWEIYERSKEIRPLGGIMALNAGIFPALEQLGIYEELRNVSLPSQQFNIYSGGMNKIATLKTKGEKELVGYDRMVFSRPELYNLLIARVASEKIHYNKKVMSIEQNQDGAMIRCSDGTIYYGDILVGADGAYSGVRQGLYRQLQKIGRLPSSDALELSKGYICMVGTTEPLNPEHYPGLDGEVSSAYQVIGKKSKYSWSAFSVPGNRICWNVVSQLATLEEAAEEKFRNSEWNPQSTEPMIAEVKDFLTPFGGTMGELISATPRDKISRVFLEDKLFETWHAGRTVLIGDACHKLLPSSGQGAVTAMQDTVALANCLYDLKSLSPDHVQEALQIFKDERFSQVQEQYEASKVNAKLIYGQTFLERCARHLIFNYMPMSVQAKASSKGMAYRPQASFLPLVADRGTCQVIPQKISKRYMLEQQQRNKTSAAANTAVI
ncbi:MAG: hypothetical protein JOS17DRAFT_822737 [Linnemannia elongata]|nr:MAG: hypothetical protein JOS17DRAFT_822737 [Linnemannia elongata]